MRSTELSVGRWRIEMATAKRSILIYNKPAPHYPVFDWMMRLRLVAMFVADYVVGLRPYLWREVVVYQAAFSRQISHS